MSRSFGWSEPFRTVDEASQSQNPNPRQPPRQVPVLQPSGAYQSNGSTGMNVIFSEEGALTGSVTSRDSNPSSSYTPNSLILPNTPLAYSHSQPDQNKYLFRDCSPYTPTRHSFEGLDAVYGHKHPLFSVGCSSHQTLQSLGPAQSLISYIGHEHNQNSTTTTVDANQEIALIAGTLDPDTSEVNYIDGEPWHRLKHTVLDESHVICSRELEGITGPNDLN
jgi:hypothetical protein